MLDASDDVMPVQWDDSRRHGQSRMVEITVDSWAVELVAPTTFAADCSPRPLPRSRSGAKCRTASGHIVVGQAETRITMNIEGGYTGVMAFHVEKQHKQPLVSAGRTMSKCRMIVQGDDGAAATTQTTSTKRQAERDNIAQGGG